MVKFINKFVKQTHFILNSMLIFLIPTQQLLPMTLSSIQPVDRDSVFLSKHAALLHIHVYMCAQ